MNMSSSKTPKKDSETSRKIYRRGICAESSINRALLEPSRFGWTAGGAIADLLPPHMVRRSSLRCVLTSIAKTHLFFCVSFQRARKNSRSSLVRRGRKRLRDEEGRIQTFSDTAGSQPVESESNVGLIENEKLRPDASPTKYEEETDKESTVQNDLTENCSETNGNCFRTENTVAFRGLSDDGKLDTNMYHRGRQGAELREENSGALLCDVEPTDTNHNFTEPKLKASVVIEFPLDDHGFSNGNIYKEVITWDLGDDNILTPLQFAADVAQNFGLSFKQMHQLAESIQNQLRVFVQDNCSYSPPVSLQAEAFQEKPQSLVPCLYGEVTGEKDGGAWYSAQQKSRSHRKSGILRAPQQEKIINRGRTGGKRKRESFSDGDSGVEDCAHHREIQRRLKAESENEIRTNYGTTDKASDNGSMPMIESIPCHVCGKETQCRLPCCSTVGHAMCFAHLKLFFPDYEESDSNSYKFSHCPICSLRCDCKSCSSVLQTLSQQFRVEHDAQFVSMERTVFDDILSRRRSLAVKSDRRRGRKRASVSQRSSVPKVPPADFPREVFNGVDIDPGSDLIYATIYTKNGTFLSEDSDSLQNRTDPLVDSTHKGSDVVLEDGSVDYCNVCMNVGNLLCCDHCPRAFHRACIADDPHEATDNLWECPSCRKERTGMIEDLIDGSKHMEQIVIAFDRCTSKGLDDELILLRTLSITYEMIMYLMEYDFGQIFRDPVDVDQFPSYRTIVKSPMDLGTIASNMINGTYFDRLRSSATLLEDSLILILQDVELVWHNCFIFNREGSAVYRMAQVQKRRATNIRSKSFDHLLTERVRCELSRYEDMLHQERQASTRISLSTRTPARHKIAATSAGAKGRPIAALDPDTGRVVKLYATMQTILAVANLFLNLNHPCEWERSEIDASGKIRKLIVMSSEDPKIRIFGYRWVFFDDLQSGLVSFEDSSSVNGRAPSDSKCVQNEADTIADSLLETTDDHSERAAPVLDSVFTEVCIGDHSYIFNTLEQALAYAKPDSLTSLGLDTKLSKSAGDYIDLDGKKWRKIKLKVDSSGGAYGKSSTARPKGIELTLLPDLVVVKEDDISCQALVGFRTVGAAYCDWLRTLSELEPNLDDSKTMEDFCQHFLFGSKSIDGLRWNVVNADMNHFEDQCATKTSIAQNGSKRNFDSTEPNNGEENLMPMDE